MTAAAVTAFPDGAAQGRALAQALGLPFSETGLHRFPDGESLVRVAGAGETTILYRSLDRPNDKLVELMLAADALRAGGCRRLILVAPYLCYMRQDTEFNPGEAVSQRVVAGFLDRLFDAVVTVDPHLHRTAALDAVFPAARAIALTATGLLADRLRARHVPGAALLIGPDAESRQWVEAVAAPLGLGVLVGEKTRRGDRDIAIGIPDISRVEGRPVFLVDDMVSTGATLAEAARILRAAGATRVEVLTTHMLAGPDDLKALMAAGIDAVESTDAVPHDTNRIALTPLLADAVGGLLAG